MMVVHRLVREASQIWDVPVAAIVGDQRNFTSSRPRQAVMYVAVKKLGLSTPRVARSLGGRDHTTVIHGCNNVLRLADKDRIFRGRLERLIAYGRDLPQTTFLPDAPELRRARQSLRRLCDDAVDQLLDLARENPDGFRNLLVLAMRGQLEKEVDLVLGKN
jgi:hypothetical protein